MSAAPRLTVVLLAYNEAPCALDTCVEIHGVLAGLAVPFEFVLVDDGSTDGTGALLDQFAVAHPAARVVHHPRNLGLGGVYRTGFREARGAAITFLPADGQFDPAEILPRFLAEIDRGADLVLGYIPGRPGSLVARGLSLAERALYRALFGRFPRFQGIVMFRRTLIDAYPLVSDGRGWAVLMELILRVCRGPHRVIGVPNTLRPRAAGTSKVNNWRTVQANLRQLWPLWRELGFRRARIRIGGPEDPADDHAFARANRRLP
ncbi:MAG: glycosyltransferase family 2 protein [Deltaproteobacteria bacterium]|nr:glycosyltransferase family 2 protein [Deltaproteobacteria bacterium]